MNISKTLIIICVSFILSACQNLPIKEPPKAIEGILDLSDWNFEIDGPIKLEGNWEFYWKQLLKPDDFQREYVQEKTGFIFVPSLWNGYEVNGNLLPGEGYATFRLTIKLNSSDRVISLKLPEFFSAYKFWVNEKVLAFNGVVGTTRKTMRPRSLPTQASFKIEKEIIQIVIQVSNFHHRKGGILYSPKIGLENQINRIREKQLTIELIFIGSVLTMGLYHLGLYFSRRKDISTLYFGLFCLLLVFRILSTGEELLVYYFDVSWELQFKIEYLSYYLIVSVFVMFLNALYSYEFSKKVARYFLVLGLLFGIFVLFIPARVYSHTIVTYQIITLIVCSYSCYALIRATLRRREGAAIFFVGTIILFLTIINDILFQNELIETTNLAPLGVLTFTFFQSNVLSTRFSNAFSKIEILSKTFEKFVPTQFLNRIAKEGIETVELGNVESDYITILFSDIRSFTTISEALDPEEVFKFLNDYMSLMEPPINEYGGFVDKFIGDSIMALFDLDTDQKKAHSAIDAAIGMQKSLKIYNQHRSHCNYTPIGTGIGIHSGNVMIGTVGSSTRMDSTAIGDAVNLASRIEGMTKIYGVSILISNATYYNLAEPSQYSIRVLDRVAVKGKTEPVTVFEVFDEDSPEIKEKKLKTQKRFEEAVALYGLMKFEEVIKIMEEHLKIFPEDKAPKIYIDRCQLNLIEGRDKHWDGITRLDTK